MIPLNYRRQGEDKKTYYRRLAQIRKAKWLSCSKNHEDSFKFHFMKRTQEEVDLAKTKKISKNEPKSEQRIRNRVAAQESRERHRTYVQELQRKVNMYQQIIQKQGLCKHCRKELVSDNTQSEDASLSVQKEGQVGMRGSQQGIQSYLKEQIIRIDNEGATTPYGIFFIICLIAVIAVFTLAPNTTRTDNQRLLANYYSNPQYTNHQVSKQGSTQEIPNFIHFIKSKSNKLSQQCAYTERNPVKKNLQSYTPSKIEGWTKVGKYICSKPQVVMNDCPSNKPQFLLVRTQRNGTEQVSSDSQKEDYKIEFKEWGRVEISQCFLGTPA